MSREAKILIFSIILIFSGYLKYSESDVFSSLTSNKSNSSKVNSESKKSSERTDEKIQESNYKVEGLINDFKTALKIFESQTDKNLVKITEGFSKNQLQSIKKYNLGVLATNSGNLKKAKDYFKVSIEFNPEFDKSIDNLIIINFKIDNSLVEEMDDLSTSKADNLRYDFLKAQRVLIYNECIPLLKSTININPTRTKKELLYRIYSILEDTEANKIKRELVKSKDLFDESIDKYNKRKAKEFADNYMKENKIKVKDDLNDSNQFDLDSPDYTTVPKSGYSPYDRYFGKGVYNSTDNSVVVKTSNNTHVVFILIDTYTGKRIRNEFIRKGETFTMTKIPYGTYDYMYFTGRNWSKDIMINNGKIKGGFKDYQNFQKNKIGRDQMEFKTGYYGSYRIELVSQVGGNLKTKRTSEQDFFN